MMSGCCVLAGVGMKEKKAENRKSMDALHEKVNNAFSRFE